MQYLRTAWRCKVTFSMHWNITLLVHAGTTLSRPLISKYDDRCTALHCWRNFLCSHGCGNFWGLAWGSIGCPSEAGKASCAASGHWQGGGGWSEAASAEGLSSPCPGQCWHAGELIAWHSCFHCWWRCRMQVLTSWQRDLSIYNIASFPLNTHPLKLAAPQSFQSTLFST